MSRSALLTVRGPRRDMRLQGPRQDFDLPQPEGADFSVTESGRSFAVRAGSP